MVRPEFSLLAGGFSCVGCFTSPWVEIDLHRWVARCAERKMLVDDLKLICVLVDHSVQLSGIAIAGRTLEIAEDNKLKLCTRGAQNRIIWAYRDILFRARLILGQDP